jgi:hypothetical protein
MDRRRFVPSADGLEGRALMSLFGGGQTASAALATSIKNLPANMQEKMKRIENLPYFIDWFQPGRYIPPQTMANIQANLVELAANLHLPPSEYIKGFNINLRHAFPHNTLSPNTAKILNHSLSVVLVQAGTDPTIVQNLSNDMNQFALVDSKSPNSAFLARSDYALIMQTAVAVGLPLQRPSAPTISPMIGKAVKGGVEGYTYRHHPTIVGTYTSGESTDGSTSIAIINNFNQVLGSGVVQSNGRYTVTVPAFLPDGKYKLSTMAIDIYGHVSKMSRPFTLRVASKPGTTTPQAQVLIPPAGPLGLK